MSPGTLIVLAVVAGAVTAGVSYVVGRWVASRVPWRRLASPPEGFEGVRYHGVAHQPDEQLLARCLLETVRLLAQHTRWTELELSWALRDVHLFVQPTPSWLADGRLVDGEQNGRTLILGRNLRAFLHEAAHLCEERLHRRWDVNHVMWAANGIRDAESSFHGWLLAQHPGGTS